MLCFSSYIIYSTFTFEWRSNSNNDEPKYILFLNVSAKDRNTRGTSTRLWCVTARLVVTCLATRLWCVTARLVVTCLATRLWCVTVWLVVTCLSPFNPVNDILIVRSSSCVGHEMLWPRGRCLVTKIWTWMQVNLSKMLTRVTKRGAGILTD